MYKHLEIKCIYLKTNVSSGLQKDMGHPLPKSFFSQMKQYFHLQSQKILKNFCSPAIFCHWNSTLINSLFGMMPLHIFNMK